MLGLYLIAAHMVGDFVLQNRWQAASKLTDGRARLRHVTGYCVPFVPVVVVYAADAPSALAAFVFLFTAHFITDSTRFRSTLGDVVGHLMRQPPFGIVSAQPRKVGQVISDPDTGDPVRVLADEGGGEYLVRPVLPVNPWPPTPIMVDQALHVCQLAILGGLFLS